MYAIKVLTDEEIYPLFLPGVEELSLLNPVLTLEMGMQGSLTFQMPASHPYREKIKILSSEFYVYQDDNEIFRGRYIGRKEDFYLTGTITCEGDLAYLLDSQQRPYEHRGSIVEFLNGRLNQHNNSVEQRKRFTRGIVNVVDNNNYINRSNSDYSDTLTSLRDKLVATHGGYLRTRVAGKTRYLDYVYDYGGINSQVIRLGENLLDMTRYMDSSTIITALIPRGAKVEYEDELGETQTKIIDITSVNSGKDYIYNENAVSQYGWIFGVQKWEDVTLPQNLLTKAKAYLDEAIYLPVTMELKAVDLSIIDVNIEQLHLGYWTRVISGPHNITGQYLLTKKVIYLDDPGNNTVTLGRTTTSFSASSARNMLDVSRRVQQMAEETSIEINRKVENATTLITGGFGGYVVLDNIDPQTGKKMHPWRILIMNAPDKETAQNVIQINQNGIGFSTSGINGPYRNAWTIDGNLVADFVTTGTMLADRIRGGTFEVGGSGLGKGGSIILRDRSDRLMIRIDIDGLKIFDASGNLSTSADKNGMNIYRGMLANYAQNGEGRATVTDGSFKVWKGSSNDPIFYAGDGGWEKLGREGSGLIVLHGAKGVILDAYKGEVATQGNVSAGDKVISAGDMECNGGFDCRGSGIFHGNIEVSGSIRNSEFSDLASRVSALERKMGG